MRQLLERPIGDENPRPDEETRVNVIEQPADDRHDEKQRDHTRQEDQTGLISRIVQQVLRQLR